MKRFQAIFLSLLALCFLFPAASFAQSAPQNTVVVKAKVVQIISTGIEPGLTPQAATTPTQTIEADIISGTDTGKVVQLTNDYVQLKVGDEFYLNETAQSDGTTQYSMNAPYRINAILIFLALFLVLAVVFGGMRGFRALISFAGSLLLIVFALIPGILHGWSPFWLSFGVAAVIIVLGSYITHGFNKTTSVAVIGMVVTVAVTGLLAYYAIHATYLTGADENAIDLNFNSAAPINLVGLLFGGIIIGLLGVLYDAAISQAVAVEELHKTAPHINRWQIFKRAMRLGREHIGALVGTLAIAYAGVSLPLILLYSESGTSFLVTINQELFATEIIRIIISSIGLILAVPITTLLAVPIIIRQQPSMTDEHTLKQETEQLEHFKHQH
jgi:uncharacterized membrane protein